MNCLRIFRFKMVLLAFLIFSYSITAETKKLLILGDSISAGYGIKESQNWVHLFNNSTDAKKMNLYMINSSVSGDTTIGGLSRISKDLKQYNPDYVLIELGGNDALRGYPLKK
ncbi:MAG: GDSL-type esterase/lipase family protein, partial [Gammaproteobacteria bacterium]